MFITRGNLYKVFLFISEEFALLISNKYLLVNILHGKKCVIGQIGVGII